MIWFATKAMLIGQDPGKQYKLFNWLFRHHSHDSLFMIQGHTHTHPLESDFSKLDTHWPACSWFRSGNSTTLIRSNTRLLVYSPWNALSWRCSLVDDLVRGRHASEHPAHAAGGWLPSAVVPQLSLVGS